MSEFEAGHLGAEEYIRLLKHARLSAEQHRSQYERGWWALVEWLPASMRPAAAPEMQPLAVEATQEALRWGHLFSRIESRIRALSAATSRLRERAAYAASLSRWQSAFDALAPFVADPPKHATSGAEKQTGNGRGRGGRRQNNEALARALLAGWNAFEPEEGRKTKERYLAQRPDVRVLTTEDARKRKIASLRVTLDSAQHLHREKTKQRQRARG